MRNLLILLFAFCYSSGIIAQTDRGESVSRNEKIETMKIAFITKKLQLTPKEAQQFWPIYNEFENKQDEVRKNRKKTVKNASLNFDKLTDKELEKLVDDELLFKQKEVDLQKEYIERFKKELPIRKIALLYQAEIQFRKELISRLKDNQQ